MNNPGRKKILSKFDVVEGEVSEHGDDILFGRGFLIGVRIGVPEEEMILLLKEGDGYLTPMLTLF